MNISFLSAISGMNNALTGTVRTALFLSAFICAVNINVNAQGVPDYSVTVGNITAVHVYEGALTITGSGVIPERFVENHFLGRRYAIHSIVIGSGITGIGSRAFSTCRNATSVVIPNSVITIGDYAFFMCEALKSVNIPSSVTSIGYAAFQGCLELETVNISNSVTEIGQYAFQGCESIKSIELPNQLTTIEEATFNWCLALESVIIPESVTSIETRAFDRTALSSITIPASVTTIGASAFANNTRLRSFYVLNPVPPTITNNIVSNFPQVCLYVPAGSETLYDVHPWRLFGCILTFVPVTGIEVDCPPSIMGVFDSETFSWKVLPEDASNKTVNITEPEPGSGFTVFIADGQTVGGIFVGQPYECSEKYMIFTTAEGGFSQTCTLKVEEPVQFIEVYTENGLKLNAETIYYICVDEEIELIAHGLPNYACPGEYQWSVYPPDGVNLIVSEGDIAKIKTEYAGSLRIWLTEKNSDVMSAEYRLQVIDEAEISLLSIEPLNGVSPNVIYGASVSFVANLEDSPYKDSFKYHWELTEGGEQGIILSGVDRQVVELTAGEECTPYTLKLTVSFCGGSVSQTISGQVRSAPVVSISVYHESIIVDPKKVFTICLGEEVLFTVHGEPEEACPLEYEWRVLIDTKNPKEPGNVSIFASENEAFVTGAKVGILCLLAVEKNSGVKSIPFRIEVVEPVITSVEPRMGRLTNLGLDDEISFIVNVEDNILKNRFLYNWELTEGGENGVSLGNRVDSPVVGLTTDDVCTPYSLKASVSCGISTVSETISGKVDCEPVVNMNTTSLTIERGKAKSISFTSNKCAPVRFSSSNPDVAFVTNNGLVSGRTTGIATITAVFGLDGCTQETEHIIVSVVNRTGGGPGSPGVPRISLPNPQKELSPGEQGKPDIEIDEEDDNGGSGDWEPPRWSYSGSGGGGSNDRCIVTVTPDGLITAHLPGSVVLRVTYRGEDEYLTVVVPHIITNIIPNVDALTMEPGDVETLRALVLPNTDYEWSSNKPEVAAVCPDGSVIGISPGVATITVSTPDGINYAQCEVTVADSPVYINCFTSEASISDWTLNNATRTLHATHGNAILFSRTGSFAEMPELSMLAEGTKGMNVVATTVRGNFLDLHTSPDGVTFTNQGVFTSVATAGSSAKPVPDGTRYIRFVARSGTWDDVFLMVAAVSDGTSAVVCNANILLSNCFETDESLSDWTLSGTTRFIHNTHGNTLRFSRGGSYAQIPALADGATDMYAVVRAVWGSSITLHTSPDGETFTNQGAFTGNNNITVGVKTIPNGTRYIRFVALPGTWDDVFLLSAAVSDHSFLPECEVSADILSDGMTLNKSRLSLEVNEIERLIVIDAPPTDNSYITWSSNNSEVATVDALTGEITAIEPGNAIITVAAIPELSPDDGVFAQVKVLVTGQENPATNINFTDCPITIEEGEFHDLTEHLQLLPIDASMPDFTIEDEDILAIHDGVLFGFRAGSTTVTATSRLGASNTCTVTVTAMILSHVTGVALNKTSAELTVDDVETLTAMVSPADATIKSVTWTSSNPSVATVVNGTVSAVSEGSTIITATTVDGGFTAQCVVTVTATANIPVTGVALNKTTTSLAIGAGETLTTTVSPADATNKYVTWTTNNPSVATVVNGTVTAVSTGTATITVTTVDGDFTAQCVVTVSATVEPDPDPDEIYGNDISSSTSVNDWTLSGVTWNSANGGQLVFETEGSFAVMPVLPCAKDMEVTITARYGNYIYLHASPDGETYTNLGLFTGHSGIVTASKTIPDNTRYIRFVAAPYTYSDVYLISVTITGVEEECEEEEEEEKEEDDDNGNGNNNTTNVEMLSFTDLKVYPNPFTGEVRITGAVETRHATSVQIQMQIINTAGAVVHTQMLYGADETINLEHLPSGIYIFRFEKDGNVKSERVVKE